MAGRLLDPYRYNYREQWERRRSFDEQSSRSADARLVRDGRRSPQSDDDSADEELRERRDYRRSIHIAPQHQADDVYYTSGNPYEASANLRTVSPDRRRPSTGQSEMVYGGHVPQPQQLHNPYQPQPQQNYNQNQPRQPFQHAYRRQPPQPQHVHNQFQHQPQQVHVYNQYQPQAQYEQQLIQYAPQAETFAAQPVQQFRYNQTPQHVPTRPAQFLPQNFRVPLRGYFCESLEAIQGGKRYISHVSGLEAFNACRRCYSQLIIRAGMGNYFSEADCERPGPPCDMANIGVRKLWSDTVQRNAALHNTTDLLGEFGRNTKAVKLEIQQLKSKIRDLDEEIRADQKQQFFSNQARQITRQQAYSLRRKGQLGKYNDLRATVWPDTFTQLGVKDALLDKRQRYNALVAELRDLTAFTVSYAGRPPPRKRVKGSKGGSVWSRVFKHLV